MRPFGKSTKALSGARMKAVPLLKPASGSSGGGGGATRTGAGVTMMVGGGAATGAGGGTASALGEAPAGAAVSGTDGAMGASWAEAVRPPVMPAASMTAQAEILVLMDLVLG